jgi:hypothetical protein
MIAPLLRAQYLEVRITDLSDMTLKFNVGPVPQQVWHVKEPSLLKAINETHLTKL